jgi:hypothetical protein
LECCLEKLCVFELVVIARVLVVPSSALSALREGIIKNGSSPNEGSSKLALRALLRSNGESSSFNLFLLWGASILGDSHDGQCLFSELLVLDAVAGGARGMSLIGPGDCMVIYYGYRIG